MYLDKAKATVEQFNLVLPGSIVPCTIEEVEGVEKQFGVKLPAAYKEYLLWMGRAANRFFIGINCFYEDLEDNRSTAVEILKRDNLWNEFTQDAFFFSMYDQFQFHFFKLSEGDDPRVFHYMENIKEPGHVNKGITLLAPSFSRYMEMMADEDTGHSVDWSTRK